MSNGDESDIDIRVGQNFRDDRPTPVMATSRSRLEIQAEGVAQHERGSRPRSGRRRYIFLHLPPALANPAARSSLPVGPSPNDSRFLGPCPGPTMSRR